MNDFKKYNNIKQIKGYDGFIDPEGDFYRVKKLGSNDGDHNLWAQNYFEKTLGTKVPFVGSNVSLMLSIAKLNGPSDFLIHMYGFIYYSHDGLLYKPIVKLPNTKLFGKNASSKSLDTLFNIALVNDELEIVQSIFEDGEVSYNGLVDDEYERTKRRF